MVSEERGRWPARYEPMTEPSAGEAASRRAVFLDRDGTINREVEYLHRAEDLEWIPGSREAIARLNASSFLVIVVTNQAGIGHGYYTESDVEALHEFMASEAAVVGARIDAFYYCPYHPEAVLEAYRIDSEYRKPGPGMLIEAAEKHGISLDESYLVGDKVIDVQAALAAGVTPILVETGYGSEAKSAGLARIVVADIAHAVDWILSHEV